MGALSTEIKHVTVWIQNIYIGLNHNELYHKNYLANLQKMKVSLITAVLYLFSPSITQLVGFWANHFLANGKIKIL